MTAILKGACQFKCVTQDFLPKVSCMLYYETIWPTSNALEKSWCWSIRKTESQFGRKFDRLSQPDPLGTYKFSFHGFFCQQRERPRSLNFSHPKGRNSQRAFISFSLEKFVIEAFCLKKFQCYADACIIKIMHDVSIEMPS